MNIGLDFNQKLKIPTVLSAVESYGYETTGHCIPLNSLENRVFFIGLENSNSVVIKFYRPNRWTKDQILEEHEFLKELAEAEIPVIAPVSHPVTGSTLSVQDEFLFTIWPNQKGRLVEEISRDKLPILGRLLARIHNQGEVKSSKYRYHLSAFDTGYKALNFLLHNNFIPKSQILSYERVAKKIFEQYEIHSKGVPTLRIHGDCHKGNLIETESTFCFIDFDDMVTGPAIQDLWMLLPFGDSNADHDRDLFLDGYREFRDFSDSWWNLVEPLRGMRYVHYSAWIARRWNDPSFPDAFPHFGTEEYWDGEIRDLETLAKGIPIFEDHEKEGKIGIQEKSPNGEKELTNKDFFWDLE